MGGGVGVLSHLGEAECQVLPSPPACRSRKSLTWMHRKHGDGTVQQAPHCWWTEEFTLPRCVHAVVPYDAKLLRNRPADVPGVVVKR